MRDDIPPPSEYDYEPPVRLALPYRGSPEPAPESRPGPALPHSLEDEREVLAAVFMDAKSWDAIRESLSPEDFYFERHSIFFRAFAAMAEAKTPIDPVTLWAQLKVMGQAERVGTRAVGELLERTGTVANIDSYVARVLNLSILRRAIDVARRIEVAGHSDVAPAAVDDFLVEAERSLREVIDSRPDKERSFGDAIVEVCERTLGVRPRPLIVPTGIGPYDTFLGGGHEGGQTYVYMCEPNVGKTSFALNNCALTTAMDPTNPGGVLFFSGEMTDTRLAQRLLSMESGIAPRGFKNCDLKGEQPADLVAAADRLVRVPIMVRRMQSVEKMLSRLRRTKDRGVLVRDRDGKKKNDKVYDLRLVIFDYWQCLPNGGRTAVEVMTEGMNLVQEEMGLLGIPAIICSQISTDARRAKKGSAMTGADAKGSGAIEERADGVAFIERGGIQRNLAGLRVTKARDLDGEFPHWRCEDETIKGGGINPACGWRWIGGKIVAPPGATWP